MLHTQVSLQGFMLATGIADLMHSYTLKVVLWQWKESKNPLAILNCCLHQCLRNSKTSNLPEWLPMFDPRKAVMHSTMRSYLFSFLCFRWLTASRFRQMFQGSKVYLMRLLPHGCSSAPSRTRPLLLQPVFSLLISSNSEPRRTTADEQSFSLVFFFSFFKEKKKQCLIDPSRKC